MLRTGLIAVLMLGLGSTAMASDRIRVFVTYDSGYHDVGQRHYGGSYGYHLYAGDGWDRWRGNDWRGHYWRRDNHRWDYRPDRRRYNGRYYSAPRGHYNSRGYHRGGHAPYRHHDGHRHRH